jgi:transposase-like protein
MSKRFTQSFKIQAVEKALSRHNDVSVKEIADALGIGYSTLQKWVKRSVEPSFEIISGGNQNNMNKERRPQDWSLQDRLNMIIACSSLDTEAVSALCRQKGVYPHHVEKWKQDFVNGSGQDNSVQNKATVKTLKAQNGSLRKELNRKDKALAETAALLVLQKKVHEIWGADEDNS